MPIEFGDSLFKEFHGELGPDGETGPYPGEEEQDPERGPLNELDRMKHYLEIMNKEVRSVWSRCLDERLGIRAQYLEGKSPDHPGAARLREQWQALYEKQAAELETAERRYDEVVSRVLPPYIAKLEASLKEDLDVDTRHYRELYIKQARAELQAPYEARREAARKEDMDFLERAIARVPADIAWAKKGRDAESEIRFILYMAKLQEAELTELRAATPKGGSSVKIEGSTPEKASS
jgi:hypothetical protein